METLGALFDDHTLMIDRGCPSVNTALKSKSCIFKMNPAAGTNLYNAALSV